jgi:hypothetical protein
MAFTFGFSSTSNEIHADIFPPIVLDESLHYEVGLIDFNSYNSIVNINQENNFFYFFIII